MTKMKPKTKEQLIYFFISNISLGTYDKKFLLNLQVLNLAQKKPLTTNQAELLDKITLRYRKQLSKLEIGVQEMLDLPWNNTPVQSLPQYTEAHLSLNEDTLILRSPYKKEFVSEFNKLNLSNKKQWDRVGKYWSIPANSYTLREVNNQLEKHYGKVNYCDKLSKLLSDIKGYQSIKYWDPTYMYVNGNYMIVGISEALHDAIIDIPFETELHTLSYLAQFGIKIDDSVIEEFLLKFDADAVSFATESRINVELHDESIIKKLLLIKVDLIIFPENITANTKLYFDFIERQVKYKINCCYGINEASSKIINSKLPVLLSSQMWGRTPLRGIAKTIHVVNSNPIDIK